MKKFKSILNQVHANVSLSIWYFEETSNLPKYSFNVKVRGNENYGLWIN